MKMISRKEHPIDVGAHCDAPLQDDKWVNKFICIFFKCDHKSFYPLPLLPLLPMPNNAQLILLKYLLHSYLFSIFGGAFLISE